MERNGEKWREMERYGRSILNCTAHLCTCSGVVSQVVRVLVDRMSHHHSYQPFVGRDFVVLCEFSEKDGPVPRELLGTPSSGFPLDQFAVKLMSVEMKMEVGEKWSIWAEWKAQGVEYLVVHFQLHDLDARGYSRQMVFAYVSYNAKKLIKHRDIYLGALNYAADLMLEANKNDWKFALHSRLLHLKAVYLYIKKEQNLQKAKRKHAQKGTQHSFNTPQDQ